MTQQQLQDSASGLAAGILYPGMNGPLKAATDAANNFMKNVNPNNPTPTAEPWPTNEPLDWNDLVSEETRAWKTLLDGAADGLDGILSGGNGLSLNFFMVSPSIMGCAGYGGLPCANGSPTSF